MMEIGYAAIAAALVAVGLILVAVGTVVVMGARSEREADGEPLPRDDPLTIQSALRQERTEIANLLEEEAKRCAEYHGSNALRAAADKVRVRSIRGRDGHYPTKAGKSFYRVTR